MADLLVILEYIEKDILRNIDSFFRLLLCSCALRFSRCLIQLKSNFNGSALEEQKLCRISFIDLLAEGLVDKKLV